MVVGMTRGWRMRTTLGAFLVLWTAGLAAAAPHRHQHASRPERAIKSVTVEHDGLGTLIAIIFNGSKHRTRFLHAHEPIDRVAVRDVDNDGDLDIVAAPE